MRGNSKLALGLLIGTALGAAVGYFAASDKKEQILDELGALVNKVKDGFSATMNRYWAQRAEAADEAEIEE
ncbi:MAG: YtxH domain-containing protein [Tannerella sp.]|nr:YtxH domain-containing protein [Tannerella sp.]